MRNCNEWINVSRQDANTEKRKDDKRHTRISECHFYLEMCIPRKVVCIGDMIWHTQDHFSKQISITCDYMQYNEI
jgi:hypothetical protein